MAKKSTTKRRKQSVKARAIERDLYKYYSERYDVAKANMEKKGESMFTRKLSPREFEDTYQSYIWDARADIRQGKKKSTGNVVLTMVSDQRYEMSKRQAETFYKAAYEYEHGNLEGYKWTQSIMDEVRAGKNETANLLEGFLSEQNEELKLQGLDSYSRAKKIAATWFGSPEEIE